MIFFPILWFVVFFGGWGLLFFIVSCIGKALQKRAWQPTIKRTVYAWLAAFLVTPLLPMPVPSVVIIIAFMLTPTEAVANQMWVFAPSFAITLVICWLVARRKFPEPHGRVVTG